MRIPTPIELLIHATNTLGDLCSEVVFLGGAVVGLLITEPGALSQRTTKDVDVAIEINSQMEFYELDKRLLNMGFTNDMYGPTCRYLHGLTTIDIIPVNLDEAGVADNWYPLALKTAKPFALPNGVTIKLIPHECFIGTKLAAFNAADREGTGDIFLSRDFGDLIRLVDGRPEIVNEVLSCSAELRPYIQDRLKLILQEEYLEEAITEHVDQGRQMLVIERIHQIVA